MNKSFTQISEQSAKPISPGLLWFFIIILIAGIAYFGWYFLIGPAKVPGIILHRINQTNVAQEITKNPDDESENSVLTNVKYEDIKPEKGD